jgi:hypothetical protein
MAAGKAAIMSTNERLNVPRTADKGPRSGGCPFGVSAIAGGCKGHALKEIDTGRGKGSPRRMLKG